jgi:hypothetical protein
MIGRAGGARGRAAVRSAPGGGGGGRKGKGLERLGDGAMVCFLILRFYVFCFL